MLLIRQSRDDGGTIIQYPSPVTKVDRSVDPIVVLSSLSYSGMGPCSSALIPAPAVKPETRVCDAPPKLQIQRLERPILVHFDFEHCALIRVFLSILEIPPQRPSSAIQQFSSRVIQLSDCRITNKDGPAFTGYLRSSRRAREGMEEASSGG